jgi:ribosomal protein S27AE
MPIDHKVQFRSYETLLASAMAERERAGVDHLCQLRFRSLIEKYVNFDPDTKDTLRLLLHDREEEPFFDRNQLVIVCNEGLWEEAGIGEPLACFKLLHELAHAKFHKDPISSFSYSTESQIAFAENWESAEWQANTWAALVMAPPYLAVGCDDRASFMYRFNFPSEFYDFWRALLDRRPLRMTPDFCPKCGSQSVAKIASRLRCMTCGTKFDDKL